MHFKLFLPDLSNQMCILYHTQNIFINLATKKKRKIQYEGWVCLLQHLSFKTILHHPSSTFDMFTHFLFHKENRLFLFVTFNSLQSLTYNIIRKYEHNND